MTACIPCPRNGPDNLAAAGAPAPPNPQPDTSAGGRGSHHCPETVISLSTHDATMITPMTGNTTRPRRIGDPRSRARRNPGVLNAVAGSPIPATLPSGDLIWSTLTSRDDGTLL